MKGKNKRENKKYSFPYFSFPFSYAVCKAYATPIFTPKKETPNFTFLGVKLGVKFVIV